MEEFSKEKKIFLGNKRKGERMNKNSTEKNKNVEDSERKVLDKLSLLRPVLNKINIIEKNKHDFDEKKEENDSNYQINENKTKNLIFPKVKENFKPACEKCGHRNNVLIFNSCQNIKEYLTSLNYINLLPNNTNIFDKYIKIKYNKPRKICSDCLLKISNNKLEFENFIGNNEFDNEYPFNDLFNNINLKNFNNIERQRKNPFLNNLNKKYLNQKQFTNPHVNNLINNTPNYIPNQNSIIEYLNRLTNQFLPYNNTNNKNNNSQNLLLQYYLLNYPNFSQISHLNQQAEILPPNYNNISNLNEKLNKNNDLDDYVRIKNKDFDELFNLVSDCYHKLLNIKNKRDLNSDLKDAYKKQDNSNFNLPNVVNNKKTDNNKFINNNYHEQLEYINNNFSKNSDIKEEKNKE